MSKNFELLHSISNEKELFETLDGWEDLPESAAENAEASPQADEKKRERTPLETALPDVFQAVSEALGPLDPFVPDLIGRPKPAREPIEGNGGGETGNTTFGERFPISRNPLARFSSVPVSSPWPEPQIAPEPELGSDAEMQLEREALESTTGPEALPSTEKARISGSNSATLEEPLAVKEEKTPWQAPQSPRASHPESPAGTRIAGSQSSGRGHARAGHARGGYKKAKRALVAREGGTTQVVAAHLPRNGTGFAANRAVFRARARGWLRWDLCADRGDPRVPGRRKRLPGGRRFPRAFAARIFRRAKRKGACGGNPGLRSHPGVCATAFPGKPLARTERVRRFPVESQQGCRRSARADGRDAQRVPLRDHPLRAAVAQFERDDL